MVQKAQSFVKDVGILTTGTVLTQLLSFVTAPVLSRLFAPDIFGAVAMFTAVVSILAVAACFRYDQAVLLPKSNKASFRVLIVAFICLFLTTSLLSIFLILAGTYIFDLLNVHILVHFSFLIPICVLSSTGFLLLNYWNVRFKSYKRIAIINVTSSLIYVSIQILGAILYAPTLTTMIISFAIYTVTQFTLLLIYSIKGANYHKHISAVSIKALYVMARRYRKFPLYDIWAAIMNSISWQIPVFLLSYFFSSFVVGYYSLGFRLLKTPSYLLGTAVAQVFFQRASVESKEGNLTSIVEQIISKLIQFGFMPFFVLTILGKEVTAVVFGANWEEAGIYIQILSIWSFVMFVSSPLTTVLTVLEKPEINFRYNVLSILTRLFSLLLGGYMNNARLALLLFAVSGVVSYLYVIGYIVFVSKAKVIKIFQASKKYMMIALLSGVLFVSLKIIFPQSYYLLAVFAIICTIGYYAVLLFENRKTVFYSVF